jgi:hypothetical protein
MIKWFRDLSGGETLQDTVTEQDAKKLALCSGYRADDGPLVPEKLAAAIAATAIPASDLPLASQTPVAFRRDGVTTVIARDADEQIRTMRNYGTLAWSSQIGECGIVTESTPAKLGSDQIIFPTKGADPKLMVFEPAAFTAGLDSLRPLSFKGPLDYSASAKPVVTASAHEALQLFDCDDAEADWTAVEEGVSPVTSGDSVVITIDSTADANSVLAKKDLGATGVSPVGKSYLVLDVAIEDDEQDYSYAGLFPNSPLMAPSGYILEFYSDQACTSFIDDFHIPKCTQQGQVYRIALNIGAITTTIKGIAIRSASFWTPPKSGSTFKIKLWSEAFTDNWTHKGNFLLPSVKWNKGAWAEALSVAGQSVSGYLDVPPTGNVVTNPGFESGTTGWLENTEGTTDWESHNETSDVVRNYLGDSRSESHSCKINSISGGTRGVTSDYISVDPEREYFAELWYNPMSSTGIEFSIKMRFYTSGNVQVGSEVVYPSTGWYTPSKDSTYHKWKTLFTTAATVAKCKIRITVSQKSSQTIRFDDVAIYLANQASSNCAYVLQTFSQSGGDVSPANPLVEYLYSFLGKDRLGVELYNHMVSNPSSQNSPSLFADPWRTYNVTIALPSDESTEETVIDEYGDYATHVLVYRRLYSGLTDTDSTGAWSDFEFIQAISVATSVTYDDNGVDATNATVNDVAVPEVVEVNNDYLASARHVCYRERRVKAFTLNWDNVGEVWKYRLGVAISSDGKPWAFPTGVAQDLLVTDGMWTETEAVTGSEIRGVLATQDDEYVFLDTEFFVLRGDNPQSGWRFIKAGDVGLADERCVANYNGTPIGLAPNGYIYAYVPGNAKPISKFDVAATVDITKPHDAVVCDDRFIFLCNETAAGGGRQKFIIYNLSTNAWTTRIYSQYTLAGICTDGVKVWGLATTGQVVDLFNAEAGTNGDQAHEVDTQFMQIGPAGYDVQATGLVVEAETDQTAVTLTFAINSKGKKELASPLSRTLTINKDVNRYRVGASFLAEAAQVKMTYTGAYPPTNIRIGIEHDEEVIR